MTRHYFNENGLRLFEIGDIVTRGDGDVHVITKVDGTITMRCVKEPRIFHGADEPWCRVDDVESNVACRYFYADPEIEALEPPMKLSEDDRRKVNEEIIWNTLLGMLIHGAVAKTTADAKEAEHRIFSKGFDLFMKVNEGALS